MIPLSPGRLLVVTIDRQASRKEADDAVKAHAQRLNREYGDRLVLRFGRTIGDELQAAANEASWLIDLILDNAWEDQWWIGVGYGEYDAPLAKTARESRGEAFYRARDAVEMAKDMPWAFALNSPRLGPVSDCLVMLTRIIRRRTARQQEAARLFHELRRTIDIAESLDLSPSSVTERLQGAGVAEEVIGRRLAMHLLSMAMAEDVGD